MNSVDHPQQIAASERGEIDALAKVHDQRNAMVPLLKDGPVGQKNPRASLRSQAAGNDEDRG